MTDVVRFRVKRGKDNEFLSAHEAGKAARPALVDGAMIETGEHSYCLIGEWVDADAIGKARPNKVSTLDTFRDLLEPMSTGMTDAVSGP